ncbi:UNKNOWN [Stylonychia lemnae]|uniref:Uncharacterized protein n=1 Tax=Stylonychia lemnae TaxID=5949 RepID=A0A078AMA5_STYLE|nr:UNKNOWN [Stylonychia lemnae]|eukprot:CDW83031.1 UNKNOWN [Stylonychia lemnae]
MRIENMERTEFIKKGLQKQITEGQNFKAKKTMYEELYELIKTRGRFRANNAAFLSNMFCKNQLCRTQKQKKYELRDGKYRSIKDQFDLGKNQVIKELDCVNIVKKLRKLDQFFKIMLSKPQQALFKHQKKELLDEFSGSEEDIEGIQFKSEKGLQMIELYKALKFYEEKSKINSIDSNILYGVVSQNPQDQIIKMIKKKNMNQSTKPNESYQRRRESARQRLDEIQEMSEKTSTLKKSNQRTSEIKLLKSRSNDENQQFLSIDIQDSNKIFTEKKQREHKNPVRGKYNSEKLIQLSEFQGLIKQKEDVILESIPEKSESRSSKTKKKQKSNRNGQGKVNHKKYSQVEQMQVKDIDFDNRKSERLDIESNRYLNDKFMIRSHVEIISSFGGNQRDNNNSYNSITSDDQQSNFNNLEATSQQLKPLRSSQIRQSETISSGRRKAPND